MKDDAFKPQFCCLFGTVLKLMVRLHLKKHLKQLPPVDVFRKSAARFLKKNCRKHRKHILLSSIACWRVKAEQNYEVVSSLWSETVFMMFHVFLKSYEFPWISLKQLPIFVSEKIDKKKTIISKEISPFSKPSTIQGAGYGCFQK